MSAPFVSQQQKQQQQSSSSSTTTTTAAAPDITCNHSKLYFPKSVPSAETKIENVLLITNNSSAPVIWKMRRSPNTPFLVHPTNGVIHPREERRISITCTGEQLQPLLAAAQENPKTWSEKLQLNSRFFHESDNRENISECWTNKKADSAMKKTKIDLPVVFADASSSTTAATASGNSNKAVAQNTKPETPSRDQQQNANNNNNDSTIANDGSPMVNKPTTAASSQARQPSLIQSSPQTARQSVQPNTNTNSTGNNAEFTASPAVQQNNNKPNPFNTTASSNTASLRQEGSLQSVAASRPESPVNNNNNNNTLQTSSTNNSTSTIAKPQQQQQQQQQPQQQQPSVSATSSTSSVEQKIKKSLAEKILLATMPVYVFVPLLVIAFSLGAKMGGGGGGVVVEEQKGKQQQQPKK